MTLGEMIRQYREEHNLSQREFARRCSLSNVAISFIENGVRPDGQPVKPKYETLYRIARGMGTSTEVLISKCDDFRIDISEDDSPLLKGFIEEMKEKDRLTDDEQLILEIFRSMTDEQKNTMIKEAMRIKLK